MGIRKLFLSNDWTIRRLALADAVDGTEDELVGETITYLISATPGGSTIHADLSGTLTETSTPGVYAATISGATLLSRLAAYDGLTVYERVQIANKYDASLPLLVVAPRTEV